MMKQVGEFLRGKGRIPNVYIEGTLDEIVKAYEEDDVYFDAEVFAHMILEDRVEEAIELYERGCPHDETAVTAAVIGRRLDALKWMHSLKEGFPGFTLDHVKKLADEDDFQEALNWAKESEQQNELVYRLRKKKGFCVKDLFYLSVLKPPFDVPEATEEEQIEAFQWIAKNWPNVWAEYRNKEEISPVADMERFRVLDWLLDQGFRIRNLRPVIRHGSLDMFRKCFMIMKGEELSWYSFILHCIRRENRDVGLAMFKMIHESGRGWLLYGVCKEAAKEGNLDVLRYAHENGFPWDSEYMCSFAKDHLPVLQYVYNEGCPLTRDVVCHAQKNDMKETLAWLKTLSFAQKAVCVSSWLDEGEKETILDGCWFDHNNEERDERLKEFTLDLFRKVIPTDDEVVDFLTKIREHSNRVHQTFIRRINELFVWHEAKRRGFCPTNPKLPNHVLVGAIEMIGKERGWNVLKIFDVIRLMYVPDRFHFQVFGTSVGYVKARKSFSCSPQDEQN